MARQKRTETSAARELPADVKLVDGKLVDEDGFEVVGGDNAPLAVGETIVGPYAGVVRTMPSTRKGKPPIRVHGFGARSILGGAVIERLIGDGKVKVGDMCKLTRLADGVAKKGQNAPKLYELRVKRGSTRRGGRQ